MCGGFDLIFNRVGDVGDDLNGFSKISTLSFFIEDFYVDASSRDVLKV